MKIEYSTDNAAFDEELMDEGDRISRDISGKVREGIVEGGIKDINGNNVGQYFMEEA